MYSIQTEKFEDMLQNLSEKAASELDWLDSHNWLNGQVHGVIDAKPAYQELYTQALNEKITLFHSDALVIYAFPVEWQLQRKLIRLHTLQKSHTSWEYEEGWSKHLGDAVDLLHEQLKGRNFEPLTDDTIKGWYGGAFEGLFVDQILKIVGEAYSTKFHADGIEYMSQKEDSTDTKKDGWRRNI